MSFPMSMSKANWKAKLQLEGETCMDQLPGWEAHSDLLLLRLRLFAADQVALFERTESRKIDILRQRKRRHRKSALRAKAS